MLKRDFITDSLGNKSDDRREKFFRKLWLPLLRCHRAQGSLRLGHPYGGPSGQGLAARPVPPPQPGAGQPGDTRAAPVPGIGHLPWSGPSHHGPVGEPGLAEPTTRQGRAVRSWRPALLWHRWSRESLLPVNF